HRDNDDRLLYISISNSPYIKLKVGHINGRFGYRHVRFRSFYQVRAVPLVHQCALDIAYALLRAELVLHGAAARVGKTNDRGAGRAARAATRVASARANVAHHAV